MGRTAIVLFVVLVSVSTDSLAKVSTRFERWLGRKTIAVLQTGNRVEAFVVGPVPVGPRGYLDDNSGFELPPGTPPTIQGFPVRRVGLKQGRPFAREIAQLVLDENSYPRANRSGPDIVKGCAFSPGVAFRVSAQTGKVDVLLCFNCDQVAVFPVGKPVDVDPVDIDPARARFVRLAKAALGDVPEVAKLSESR